MNKKGMTGFLVFLFILVIVLGGTYYFVYQFTSGSESISVSEKWVKYQDKDAKYLISTDKGVYQITDSLWRGQWRSSDIYGCLHSGNSYNIKYFGFRMGFFSDYRNIYFVEGCKIE